MGDGKNQATHKRKAPLGENHRQFDGGVLLDTVPFVLIAFAGTVTTRDLLLMMALQYVMKMAIEATMGTPMAYGFIAMLKKIDDKR